MYLVLIFLGLQYNAVIFPTFISYRRLSAPSRLIKTSVQALIKRRRPKNTSALFCGGSRAYHTKVPHRRRTVLKKRNVFRVCVVSRVGLRFCLWHTSQRSAVKRIKTGLLTQLRATSFPIGPFFRRFSELILDKDHLTRIGDCVVLS